jgi:hypothetical protein
MFCGARHVLAAGVGDLCESFALQKQLPSGNPIQEPFPYKGAAVGAAQKKKG